MYFDNASSILYEPKIINNLLKYSDKYSNPHSLNTISKTTGEKIEDIRKKILNYVKADENKYTCVFTSGTTDSLKRIGEYFIWNNNSNFIYTIDNHTSVVGIREYALNNGSDVNVIDFNNCNDIIEINKMSRPKCKLNKGTKIKIIFQVNTIIEI